MCYCYPVMILFRNLEFILLASIVTTIYMRKNSNICMVLNEDAQDIISCSEFFVSTTWNERPTAFFTNDLTI